jgi:hypothetical protein
MTGVSSGIVGQDMSQVTIRVYNNTFDVSTGMNVGNGLVIQPPHVGVVPGVSRPKHRQKQKKTHYLLFNLTEWWYQVTGRKWTSEGDGPLDYLDSPDSWNQLETNKGIPAGDNIQVEPTKFLFDDGSGLNWVDVGAEAGAAAEIAAGTASTGGVWVFAPLVPAAIMLMPGDFGSAPSGPCDGCITFGH